MNPNHEVTAMSWRQLLKELPRCPVCLQRFGNVGRHVWDRRPWRVGFIRWRGNEASRLQETGCLKVHPALSIDVRPLAHGPSRSKLACVAVFIETFDQAVDPAEAQRLANRLFVGD